MYSIERSGAMRICNFIPALLLLQTTATNALATDSGSNAMVAKPGNTTPPKQHLLGDWSEPLKNAGLDVTFEYIGQLAGNISGGKRSGWDYAQQLELDLGFDWDKIVGVTGFSTTAKFVNRVGRNASKDYVGDNIVQAQSVYGGAGNVVVHLAELYAEQKLFSSLVDVEAGRLVVGEDYATSPLYCEFMNTAICAYPNSLARKEGFTAFPNATWGVRLRVALNNQIYGQIGAYEVRPKAGGPSGFNWSWSGTTGIYYPIELGYEPKFGTDQLEGHYKIGFAYDTTNYPDLYTDVNGLPLAQTGDAPALHESRSSYYLLGDQMLIRNGNGPENGLVLMGGFTWSDEDTSQISRFAFAGITDQGIIPSRPDYSFGIVVAWQKVSPALASTQRIEAASGLPLAKEAVGVQSDETIIEARYNIAVLQGLGFMPDLQYVIHPGAAHTYPNTWVLGFQLKADL